ncbi:MAG: hypothetical protein ABFE13_11520 [Phycisphaerales bacterium]
MGTDIHPIIEIKTDSGWKIGATNVPRDRNYVAFAILADVRNGYGFAGVDTGDPVVPISQPRGLPEDSPAATAFDEGYFGDHSFSWVTLKELLALDLDGPVVQRGMVTKEQAEEIKRGKSPETWCGWTSEADHVTAEWTMKLRDAAPLLVELIQHMQWQAEFVDEDPERVRLVFGFDS